VIDLQWPHHSLVAEVCRQSEGIRKQVCMNECPAIGQGGVGSNPPVLCGWLPRCKLNLILWRIGRVQSSVRPVDAVGKDCWP